MSCHLISNESSPWQQGWLVEHVPPDVWREIFKIHLADFFFAYPAGGADGAVFPALLLCQICSRWREIATNAPELWNRVSLYIRASGDLHPHPEFLNLALDRSGSVPLKILLDGRIKKRMKKITIIRNSVWSLLKNFHRAAEIDINTKIFTLPKLLSDPPLEVILPTGMPLLQNVVLRSGSAKATVDPRLSRIWTMAPNLRNVVFDSSTGFKYFYPVNTLQIPFGQLTSVTIGPAISARCLYELLSMYKNLVECVVCNLKWGDEFQSNRIFLPTLQRLSIRIPDNGYRLCQGFLVYLKSPALKTLNLEDSGNHRWSYEVFASFLRISSCAIQHLGINILPFTDDAVLMSLYLLSDLISLKLRSSGAYAHTGGWRGPQAAFNKTLISELGKWDTSRKEFSLLPRLEKITVDYNVIPDPDDSAMFPNMVEDRQIAAKVMKVKEPEYTYQQAYWNQKPRRWCPCALLRLLVLKHHGFDVELDPEWSMEAEVFRPCFRRLG